jgi:uncharacterized protein (TIGR00369 family)
MDSIELITAFLKHSPFALHVGLRLREIEPDHAVLEMPFSEELATYGEVVHGGAIGTLVDTAATAASWAGAEMPETPRGATISLTVNYVRAATGQDVVADARVVRRGRSLCFCDVRVTDAEDRLVAHGVVTYRVG